MTLLALGDSAKYMCGRYMHRSSSDEAWCGGKEGKGMLGRSHGTRILIAVASLCVPIALGCNTHSQAAADAAKPTAPPPLFKPEAATLVEQQMCSVQAEKKFHEDESIDLHGSDKQLYSYTSHYDPVVNICYIRVHSVGRRSTEVSDVVYDGCSQPVTACRSTHVDGEV